ncbi:MAG: acyltransferase [Odoribacter sp.]
MRIFSTYYFVYLKYLFRNKDNNILINFYRKKGVAIGTDCAIYSKIITPESYLISIGDNVTIAPGVRFITHDNSVSKVLPEFTDVFGRITIGNNCFIGAGSIILPGITLGNTCIVAAGSVVTKSFAEGKIIAGNPAKEVSTIENYRQKIKPYCFTVKAMDEEQKKSVILKDTKLIVK